MPFDASDAGGWDECLPSVAACKVHTEAGPADIPDHGDLWRLPWTVLDQTPQSVTLSAGCFSVPLTLKRSLAISEIENGVRLSLGYRLTNTGSVPIPWSWAAHPLFVVEQDDRIILPDSIKTLRLEGSGGNRLGKRGDEVQWPIADLSTGFHADLTCRATLPIPALATSSSLAPSTPATPGAPLSAHRLACGSKSASTPTPHLI